MGLSNNLSCEAEVSPAAAPTPRGVFTQRFEALFPCAGALGCFAPLPLVLVYLCVNMGPRGLLPAALPTPFSATLSPALSVYLCVNVGPQVLLEVRLPAQFIPHSASLGLGPPTTTRFLSAPAAISTPPTTLDECYFLSPWCRTSLLFDFLSVLVVRGGAVCLPMPPSWFSSPD